MPIGFDFSGNSSGIGLDTSGNLRLNSGPVSFNLSTGTVGTRIGNMIIDPDPPSSNSTSCSSSDSYAATSSRPTRRRASTGRASNTTDPTPTRAASPGFWGRVKAFFGG